jgi:glyoxylate reductase
MSQKLKVLVTTKLPSAALEPLFASHEVDYFDDARAMPREALIERVRSVDGLVCSLNDKIDAEVIAAAASLKVIADVAVGYNNVDVAAAKARQIVVTNTPDVLTDATADLTLGLILGIMRRLTEGDRVVRRGGWTGFSLTFMLGSDLRDKQLGIIGLGRIGQAVARRAAAFGMTIAYQPSPRQEKKGAPTELGSPTASPQAHPSERTGRAGATQFDGFKATPMGFDELLSTSDVISLHVPLTDATRHLIDKRAFARMKHSAYLINVARGPVVDEAGLAWALREGVISGAALDVFEREPEVHEALLSLDNVMLVPHLGSATRETRTKMASLAIENCLEVLAGRPALTPIPEMKPAAEKG